MVHGPPPPIDWCGSSHVSNDFIIHLNVKRRLHTGESWDPLPSTRSGGRIGKTKKIFRKAGKKPGTQATNATVVFVPSTRGSTLVRSLKEDEDRMAEITGFKVKFQEAGGSILANAFNTNLGSGQPCGRAGCPQYDDSGGKVDCKARRGINWRVVKLLA